MTKRLVIYGVGQTSEVLSHLIESDESVEIVAYCNENKNSNQQFLEKPIVGLTDVKNIYDPNEHLFFVAIGYRNGNKIREKYIKQITELGYHLYSYIASPINSSCQIGPNTVITSNNFIQPRAHIGTGVFIWGGCVIGHHTKLENYAWISPSVTIGGNSTIGERSFIGMGSVVNQFVNIAHDSVLGSKTLINRDLDAASVIIEEASPSLGIKAEKFWKIGGVK